MAGDVEIDAADIEHGIFLLREIGGKAPWTGRVGVVEIDHRCEWNTGDGPCTEPLARVHVFQPPEDTRFCHALAVCLAHSIVLRASLVEMRDVN